jgi:hypothetical protein
MDGDALAYLDSDARRRREQEAECWREQRAEKKSEILLRTATVIAAGMLADGDSWEPEDVAPRGGKESKIVECAVNVAEQLIRRCSR